MNEKYLMRSATDAGHDRRRGAGEHELEEELRVQRDAGPGDRLVGARVGVAGRRAVVGAAEHEQALDADEAVAVAEHRPQPNT